MLAGLGLDMTPRPDDEAVAGKDFTALLTAAGMPAEVRRRLLIWATLKVWAAKATGAIYGVGSSMLAHAAGAKASALVMTAAAALSAPVGVGVVAGILAYRTARSLVKEVADDHLAPALANAASDDAKVKDAFLGTIEHGTRLYEGVLAPGGVRGLGDVTAAKLTRLAAKADLAGGARDWAAREAQALAEWTWAEANKGNPEVAAALPEMLNKLNAVRRLGAAAADAARADWKAGAAQLVTAAAREADLDPGQIIRDELAAALAPTPGAWVGGCRTAVQLVPACQAQQRPSAAGSPGSQASIPRAPPHPPHAQVWSPLVTCRQTPMTWRRLTATARALDLMMLAPQMPAARRPMTPPILLPTMRQLMAPPMRAPLPTRAARHPTTAAPLPTRPTAARLMTAPTARLTTGALRMQVAAPLTTAALRMQAAAPLTTAALPKPTPGPDQLPAMPAPPTIQVASLAPLLTRCEAPAPQLRLDSTPRRIRRQAERACQAGLCSTLLACALVRLPFGCANPCVQLVPTYISPYIHHAA